MTETVRARVAPSVSLRRASIHERVLDTLWFIPACGAIGAAVLSRVALEIDLSRDIESATVGLTGDRAAFGTVASTITAAMLTFLGVVFSTTIVAVQLAASQYSPRIVRVFVRSRLTQATLSVFLATFVYSLTALVRVETNDDEFVPQVTLLGLLALVFATVAMFVAYVHGMVRLLRVQYLLRVTARSSHDAVDHAFPPAEAYRSVTAPAPSPDPIEVRNVHPEQPDARGTPRVLQAIDVAGLADAAAWAGGWIEMCVAVGDHAGPGTVVARVHTGSSGTIDAERVLSHMLFGSERTLVQDPAFGLRQLVDTASRALSPAINDPTTAVQALYRIVDLLERVAHRPDPTGWYVDATGTVRVRLMEDDFARLLRLGLVEVMRYGADAPQVTRAVLGSIDELAAMVDPERLPLLEEMREMCRHSITDSMPAPFAELAGQPDRAGLG